MTAQQHKLQQLTVEQDQEITNDITLLVVALCALNEWTMDEIVSSYEISESVYVLGNFHLAILAHQPSS